MPKNPIIAVDDILKEIAYLQELRENRSLAELFGDPTLRRAAAYSVQIISEAVRHIPEDWLGDYPAEPWRDIKAIGNKIRHEYFRLDDAILWDVITNDIDSLDVIMHEMKTRHQEK